MKTFLRSLFFIILCGIVASCHYDKYDTLIKPGLPKETIPDNVSYSKNVVPIFSTFCYSCHSGANKASGGQFELDSFSYITQKYMFTSPNDSTCTLIKCITWTISSPTEYMPNNGQKLSDANIAIIQKWVEQGAQNN